MCTTDPSPFAFGAGAEGKDSASEIMADADRLRVHLVSELAPIGGRADDGEPVRGQKVPDECIHLRFLDGE